MAITVEIDIDDELLAEAQAWAERLGITLSELFNKAVNRYREQYEATVSETQYWGYIDFSR